MMVMILQSINWGMHKLMKTASSYSSGLAFECDEFTGAKTLVAEQKTRTVNTNKSVVCVVLLLFLLWSTAVVHKYQRSGNKNNRTSHTLLMVLFDIIVFDEEVVWVVYERLPYAAVLHDCIRVGGDTSVL